jgi:hypothetical protein
VSGSPPWLLRFLRSRPDGDERTLDLGEWLEEGRRRSGFKMGRPADGGGGRRWGLPKTNEVAAAACGPQGRV